MTGGWDSGSVSHGEPCLSLAREALKVPWRATMGLASSYGEAKRNSEPLNGMQ